MQLKQPFLKLPIRFDAEALAAEVRALPAFAWTSHPSGIVGNEAVRLVTPLGEDNDDIEGPMAARENLRRCDYVRQIMTELGGVWGRSRFMGLAPGREVPPHIDIHYYWRTHLRIHIPVITNPGVLFTCGDETVHMAAGECWIFNSFLRHDVQNKGDAQRIHLVLDTVGGGLLPELIAAAGKGKTEPRLVAPSPAASGDLQFERVNCPKVMSPWEMRCHLAFVREQAGEDPRIVAVLGRVEGFIDRWTAAWARFGTEEAGRPAYDALLRGIRADVAALDAATLALPNEVFLGRILEQLIFYYALARHDSLVSKQEEAVPLQPTTPFSADEGGGVVLSGLSKPADKRTPKRFRERFDRPIFLVSTPRSGSTLLYETLENAPGLFATGDESHRLIETVPGLAPHHRGWLSNRLLAIDATADHAEALAASFYNQLKDRDGRRPAGRVRMLEKTPKNALRVPFFNAIWPDAHFIYLYRDARETLYSMMEAWHSGGFRTYPGLPGWQGLPWSLLLVPDWQRLNGLQLPEIVAHQWAITTETMLNDLDQLPGDRVSAIDYGTFVRKPQAEVERLAATVSLGWDQQLGDDLPLSKTTVSKPQPDKWRRIAPIIETIWPIVDRVDKRARSFLERHGIEGVASPRPQAESLGLEHRAG